MPTLVIPLINVRVCPREEGQENGGDRLGSVAKSEGGKGQQGFLAQLSSYLSNASKVAIVTETVGWR